jgi:hypothetical protein
MRMEAKAATNTTGTIVTKMSKIAENKIFPSNHTFTPFPGTIFRIELIGLYRNL